MDCSCRPNEVAHKIRLEPFSQNSKGYNQMYLSKLFYIFPLIRNANADY